MGCWRSISDRRSYRVQREKREKIKSGVHQPASAWAGSIAFGLFLDVYNIDCFRVVHVQRIFFFKFYLSVLRALLIFCCFKKIENRAGPSNLGTMFSQIILCKQLAPDFNAEELRSIRKDSEDIQRLIDDLSEFMPIEESHGRTNNKDLYLFLSFQNKFFDIDRSGLRLLVNNLVLKLGWTQWNLTQLSKGFLAGQSRRPLTTNKFSFTVIVL